MSEQQAFVGHLLCASPTDAAGEQQWPELMAREETVAGGIMKADEGAEALRSRWGILSPSTRTKGIIKELNQGRASSEVHFEKVPLPVR